MQFTLRSLAAAAALALGSAGAFAATAGDLGTNPSYAEITGYGTQFGPVTFSYSFTLDSATNLSDLFGSLKATDESSILVTLSGPTSFSTTITPTLTTPKSFTFSGLADGAYTLSFVATPIASTFAAYGGFATTVAAVPEPESMALVLAGLGVMGMVARRRTSVRA
ncbi:MAG: FxDxF family PEP-CTERM protein [Aquabacterium sp.]|jgi:hypothetical protein|uniref:FxDxF family PEP-CTERM protein n=1 Tax=Aquabacterium sp. TaxID=1872578 RepID=UPI003BB1B1E5